MTNIGDTEASVRVELLGSELSAKEERIPVDKTVKCSLTFNSVAGKIYTVVISGISGVTRYSVGSDPQTMRARVVHYEFERQLDSLTYFSAQSRSKIGVRTEDDITNRVKQSGQKKIVIKLIRSNDYKIDNTINSKTDLEAEEISNSGYTDTIYYDLETIPLDVSYSLVDVVGSCGQKSLCNTVTRWELVAIDEISKTEIIDDNQTLFQKTNPLNKMILFKGKDNKFRLLIDWIEEGDVNSRVKVGQIKGYDDSSNCLVFSDLVIRPLDPTVNSKNKDWDKTIFDKVKEIRTGTMINNEFYQLSIPFQMLRGMVSQESDYREDEYYRYEPFSDLNNFYYNKGTISKIKNNPELYKTLCLTEGDTIYDVVWSRVQKKEVQYTVPYDKDKYIGFTLNPNTKGNVYPPALWNTSVRNIFDSILLSKVEIDLTDPDWEEKESSPEVIKEKTERLKRASRYLEICLNYGREVAKRYYQNGMIDFYDPTKFEDMWKHVGKSYANHPNKALPLNPKAEKPYNYHPSCWPQDDNEVNELKTRFVSLLKSKGIDVAKEYWETWLKYDKNIVDNWYNADLQENLHPKKLIGQTPFIAQQKISASYGPMQLMYESAYDLGYRADPLWEEPTNSNSLINYKTSIPLSMDYYISVKMRTMLIQLKNDVWKSADPTHKGHYVFKFPLDDWSEIFSESLVYYNGVKTYGKIKTYGYPVSVRTKEANLLPDLNQ